MILVNRVLVDSGRWFPTEKDAIVYDDLLEELASRQLWHGDFVLGSIEDMRYLKSIGCERYASYWNLRVSEFLPHIRREYLNFDGVFKQACQLGTDDCGSFARSDSGEKLWSGQVITDAGLLSVMAQRMQPDDMVLVAEDKEIDCERRYWVSDGHVIASTFYSGAEQQEHAGTDEAGELDSYVANVIIPTWEPDRMYTVDVCLTDCEPRVVEYNCWSTSGFYGADMDAIIEETKKARGMSCPRGR